MDDPPIYTEYYNHYKWVIKYICNMFGKFDGFNYIVSKYTHIQLRFTTRTKKTLFNLITLKKFGFATKLYINSQPYNSWII